VLSAQFVPDHVAPETGLCTIGRQSEMTGRQFPISAGTARSSMGFFNLDIDVLPGQQLEHSPRVSCWDARQFEPDAPVVPPTGSENSWSVALRLGEQRVGAGVGRDRVDVTAAGFINCSRNKSTLHDASEPVCVNENQFASRRDLVLRTRSDSTIRLNRPHSRADPGGDPHTVSPAGRLVDHARLLS